MSLKIRPKEALDYHENKPHGKIEVKPTKSIASLLDLALAYSPGVAEPCKAIAKNKQDIYRYTAKGNLVGVISNGTAVLGLGDIGPEASKPVMEGKGVLFKKYAGIDVFDIEINEKDPQKFIEIVKALEPTFGGINLEDIKAPESFIIEKELRKSMSIPLMHDDQHGTAIISAAGLLNAIEVANKKIDEIKIVVSGAGAAAIACINLYVALGVKQENIVVFDSKGIINTKRDDLDIYKKKLVCSKTFESIGEALKDSDMFLGLSIANILTADMLLSMAVNPIVFALANPDPEIAYEIAIKVRKDIIMATGRSDHPNQVNNVLGFPYIFRGALDVRATEINEEMKLAAVKAIADLAKRSVPDMVLKAYGKKKMKFGKDYIIPKPMDHRLITSISPAVAKAAMESGFAKMKITDWEAYEDELLEKIGRDQKLISRTIYMAKRKPKKVLFVEANHVNILKTAQMTVDTGIGIPILMGEKKHIKKLIEDNDLDGIGKCKIIDPSKETERLEQYAQLYYKKRQRKGITQYMARKAMAGRTYFGLMMVEMGEADVLVSGLSNEYPKTLLPCLQIIGTDRNINRAASMYIINTDRGNLFFADTTVNKNPTAEELVQIIGLTHSTVKGFDTEPKIAVLSYSNFGSSKGETPDKVASAVRMAKQKWPSMIIDGDIQANVALNKQLLKGLYPFSSIVDHNINTLIFPDLQSANIAYKLVMEVGDVTAIGPILMGMKKSVQVIQQGSSVNEIFNMVAIAVMDASEKRKKKL